LLQYGTPIEDMGSKEFNIFCRNLGHRVINAINSVTVVTPHALVAAALMNCSKKSFSFDHLTSHVETYMNHLLSQKASHKRQEGRFCRCAVKGKPEQTTKPRILQK
jgi:glycerol-3-phosphate O-acyltransferase